MHFITYYYNYIIILYKWFKKCVSNNTNTRTETMFRERNAKMEGGKKSLTTNSLLREIRNINKISCRFSLSSREWRLNEIRRTVRTVKNTVLLGNTFARRPTRNAERKEDRPINRNINSPDKYNRRRTDK